MKKLILLVTVIFTVVIFIGNASAISTPTKSAIITPTKVEGTIPTQAKLLDNGYTQLISNTGTYSSTNIDFTTFKWGEGDADYIHKPQIKIGKNTDSFYLTVDVENDGKMPFDSDDTFTSKRKPLQFQTYQHKTGGYFWLIEDVETNSDKDFNDLWLSVDANKSAPVPVPAAVWLLGSGLVGLVGLRRSKSK